VVPCDGMLRARSPFHASELGGKWFCPLGDKLIVGRGAAYGSRAALFHVDGSEGRSPMVGRECITKEGGCG
jgi:hypothetical protein